MRAFSLIKHLQLVSKAKQDRPWGYSTILGAYIAALNGLMFIMGTSLSSVLYLIPVAFGMILLLSGQLTIDQRKLSVLVLLAMFFSFGLLRTVTNTIVPPDAFERALINYGRGLTICFGIFLFVRSHADIASFIKWYGFVSIILIILSTLLGISYLGDGTLYEQFGALFVNISRPKGFSGLYNSPNYWSIYCLTVIPFFFYLRARNNIRILSLYLLLALLSFQLLQSGSRMGILGLLLVILVYFFYILVLDPRKSYTNRLTGLTVFLGALTIATTALTVAWKFLFSFVTKYFLNFEIFVARTQRLVYAIEEESRFQRIQYALSLLTGDKFNLIFGAGLRAAGAPHNSLVSVLVELGVFVAVFFFVFVGWILYRALTDTKTPRSIGIYLFSGGVLMIWLSATNDFIETRCFWVYFPIFWCAVSYRVKKIKDSQ